MDRVRLFASGSQDADWYASNCEGCTRAADQDNPPRRCPCDIEQAMVEAYMGDGTVSAEIARRAGWAEGRGVWPCPEHDPPFVNVRPDGSMDPSIADPGV